ncbi:unnamed protein product [Paramecium sonneborni]|uniref:Uncharacterized protein n=1 Tax=Paramecium sonneborni TaxID=65129 RepID=A0A8S1Q2V0_9CILI|nr:unnamed protein product [Paramecium sonneborni]
MGCSLSSKKNQIKLQSLQLQSNSTAIQQEQESEELAILNQLYKEKFQIQKNPIVQRRAHSATPSISGFDRQAELQNSLAQRQLS